jgi:hypothetical protein
LSECSREEEKRSGRFWKMASRLVPHAQAPSHEHEIPPQQRITEENEDNKVYYGFGVFMGLPLADLKAMKESYMQNHSVANGDAKMDSAMHGAPASAADKSASYSHLPCREDGEERRGGRNSHNSHESYEDQRDGEQQSDASEDSYGQPKSHSLNFILH